MIYERPVEASVILPGAASPPTSGPNSKSSKSSSFHSSRSFGSDRDSILTDASHFEDIGLEDDAPSNDRDLQQPKREPSPFTPSYASDLRAKSLTSLPRTTQQLPQRSVSKSRTLQISQREIANSPRRRPSSPNLGGHSDRHDPHVRNTSTNHLFINPLPLRNNGNHRVPNSRPSVLGRRNRTPSPNVPSNPSLNLPRNKGLTLQTRRTSWQSNRERKSEAELERECDEDDGDDIPDGFVLDNVPLSPRPMSERAKSQPPSKANSPERPAKEKVRSVGNGTPAIAAHQGSIGELRSPIGRSESTSPSLGSPGALSPLNKRASSWNLTLAGLSKDAKEITEKLEEHADQLEVKAQRSSTGSIPKARRTSENEAKPKHKSALPELPPLRRSNIMIDPLPISKEKEAVLSRTRPSWLPPKDPAEERRHLKEYQKMMTQSRENERRREEQKKAMSKNKDTAADSLMQIWEHDIVPRWNDAIRERRTRELWWRGVAPRSRGTVWTRAIGNDLGLTEKSFTAALGRAHAAEAREKAGHGSAEDHKCVSWMRAIRKDVEEYTFRDLRIFQAGGPLHESLMAVLSAYAMYRSDIGYVSGCHVSTDSKRPCTFLWGREKKKEKKESLTLSIDDRRALASQSPIGRRCIHYTRQRLEPGSASELLLG